MVTREEKEVQRAIGQIAAEHHFFTELKDYLQRLKKTIVLAKPNAQSNDSLVLYSVQKLFRDEKYIGIAERRFTRYENHVENILSSITQGTLPVAGQYPESLRDRLHLEAANLLRDSSRYEGRVYHLLVRIKECVKNVELKTLRSLVKELEEVVDDAEKWIAALSNDLSAAKKLVLRYEDPGVVDFTNRHTLAFIMEMMRQHDFTELNVKLNVGWITIYSRFGSGAGFDISQRIGPEPRTNPIIIGFTAVYKRPYQLFDRGSYKYVYDPATTKKSFKKVLENILEIIQNTVKYGKTPQVPVSKQIEKVF